MRVRRVNGAKQHEGPRFEAAAAITTRWRWIDRAGSVTINDGRLSLRKQSGEVVAEGPMKEVWAVAATRFGAATDVRISGERYYIRPPERESHAGDVIKLVDELKAGKELREEFLEVVESEGGHIGTPDR